MKTLTELWNTHVEFRDKWDISKLNRSTVDMLVTYAVYKAMGGQKELDISSHVFSTEKAKATAEEKYKYYIEGIVDFIHAIEIYTRKRILTSEMKSNELILRDKYGFDYNSLQKYMDIAKVAHIHNKVSERVIKLTRDRSAGDVIYAAYEYYRVIIK